MRFGLGFDSIVDGLPGFLASKFDFGFRHFVDAVTLVWVPFEIVIEQADAISTQHDVVKRARAELAK